MSIVCAPLRPSEHKAASEVAQTVHIQTCCLYVRTNVHSYVQNIARNPDFFQQISCTRMSLVFLFCLLPTLMRRIGKFLREVCSTITTTTMPLLHHHYTTTTTTPPPPLRYHYTANTTTASLIPPLHHYYITTTPPIQPLHHHHYTKKTNTTPPIPPLHHYYTTTTTPLLQHHYYITISPAI